MSIRVLLAAALAAASPAVDGWEWFEKNPEGILVERRHSYPICIGTCTESDLAVRADGLVLLRVRPTYGGPTKSFRYRVSQTEVQEFWRSYASIRPKGLKGPVGDCNAPQHMPIIDWDIRWQDSTGQSRLLACTGADDVAKTVREGFRILRISPVTGKRLTAEQAESLR